MDNFEIKSDKCGGFMIEPYIDTISTNKLTKMIKLQNDFTTLEQSKRLLELGVPADSANLHFLDFGLGDYSEPHYGKGDYENGDLPSWSVGRLNEIFKICSDNHIEIYDLDLEDTQMERAMQAFENYAEYNWLDFSKLEDYE